MGEGKLPPMVLCFIFITIRLNYTLPTKFKFRRTVQKKKKRKKKQFSDGFLTGVSVM